MIRFRDIKCYCTEHAMFKYILVPITGTDVDSPVHATALAVARLAGCHVEFLHVRIDVQQILMAMATGDTGDGIGYHRIRWLGYDRILEALEDVAARQKKTEVAFRDFCERERLIASSDPAADLPTVELRLETGDEPTWLAQRGRTADLLVVGRARAGEAVAMDVLEACVLASGRPVLIAPSRTPRRLPGTVAIAWKNRPEAARAVAAAQPFVVTADRVVIFSIDEGDETEDKSCEHLRYALAWHNRKTTVRRLKRDERPPVEVLLAAADAEDADLLVMGGYGHSRVREVVFGGFTRRVLHDANLPILMAH
jgi:nucleotide-binding universal stress UspA family protein